MKIFRMIYGLFALAFLVLYFQPWLVINGQTLAGWTTIFPFSFFYFIGVVLTIIVSVTRYRAVGLSILAGIFMFGNSLVMGIFIGLLSIDKMTKFGSGFAYAFFLSLLFLVLGPIFASKFTKSTNVHFSSSETFWKKLLWGVVIAVLAGLILHYIFHIG